MGRQVETLEGGPHLLPIGVDDDVGVNPMVCNCSLIRAVVIAGVHGKGSIEEQSLCCNGCPGCHPSDPPVEGYLDCAGSMLRRNVDSSFTPRLGVFWPIGGPYWASK